jgi:hypothetical protein
MSTSDSNAHDRIHHRLFSYSEVVEDLLRQVVRRLDFAGSGAWIDDLDWSTLRREPEISTSKKLDRRIRDVVWSVSWRGGPLFLILLIEFQSQPNRFMALRQLTYLSLFYEDLVKSGRIGSSGLLPPALPICLYNGEEPWRSPLALEELVSPYPRELRRFQPRFRYLLIDELKTPVEISGERNIAGSIFALQQVEKHQQLLPVLEAIDRWLPAADQVGLRHDLLTLVRQQLPDPLLADGGELSLEKFAMGVKERLTQELEDFERKLGNLEQFGQDKQAEGKRGLVGNLLRLKFGPLPASADSRLAGADVDQLEIWAARILTASTLGEVFQD